MSENGRDVKQMDIFETIALILKWNQSETDKLLNASLYGSISYIDLN